MEIISVILNVLKISIVVEKNIIKPPKGLELLVKATNLSASNFFKDSFLLKSAIKNELVGAPEEKSTAITNF